MPRSPDDHVDLDELGTMIVHQPGIPAPVLINFPLPAWATRSEEVDDQGLDKAAQEFAGKF